MNSTDIARLCGVSRSTVSRVINNYPNVPEATRQKVLKVIEEYNFVPNSSARNLVGKKNKVLALFVVDMFSSDSDTVHASPTYSNFLLYIVDHAKQHGYNILVSIIKSLNDYDNVHELFASKIISGGIFIGDPIETSELNYLEKSEYCVAMFSQSNVLNADSTNTVLFNPNNVESVEYAINLFIKNGHTKIAHITGNPEKLSTKERLWAYERTLLSNGIPYDKDFVVFDNFHHAVGGYNAMKKLFQRNKIPTALFVSNSIMAVGAIKAIQEAGLRVTEDISIIGYGNMNMIEGVHPFTTIETPLQETSIMMVDSLIKMIKGEPLDKYVYNSDKFELRDRGTVKNLLQS